MAVTLNPVPGVVLTREKFLAEFPSYSIGLDGVIADQAGLDCSFVQQDPPMANFDHHSGWRPGWLTTTEQAFEAINMGLFDLFNVAGIPTAMSSCHHRVIANDRRLPH